jgi:hypothetical protein
MSRGELVFSVGAEGGSIAMYGDRTDPAHLLYRVLLADHTPTFLDERDGGPAIRKDSGWLNTWPEAVAALSRWPWAHLVPVFVHDSVKVAVRDAWNAYNHVAGREPRSGASERWKRAYFGIPQN